MRRLSFWSSSVLAAGLLTWACADNDTTALGPEPGPSAARALAGAKGAGTGSYVILGMGNKLPKNFDAAVAAAGGEVEHTMAEIGAAIVSSDAPNFLAAVSRIRGVQEAAEDVVVQWSDPNPLVFQYVEEFVDNPPNSADDDLFFDLQWSHDAINAVESRTAGHTGAGVRIAILDSGIDAQHPDLAPNLNLALSASFVPGEAFDIRPGVYFNHGSHVAGIAAAADNGVGVVGVAPEAEIVAVKVLSEFTGSGSFAGVGSGIVYAALIDADIINMSLGAVIPNATGPGIAALKNFLKRAVQFAHSRGATIIVAAGNEAIDRDHDRSTLVLPADLPHVIQVSATAPEVWAGNPNADFDVLAHYSNFGQSTIDFSAPGGDFDQLATPPCIIGPFIVNPCGVADFVVSASSQSWFFAAGTSMAAPHVSGVAALIIARNGGDMNPAHVEAALRQSSDDIGKPGRDDVHGHGRVNAARAVGIL